MHPALLTTPSPIALDLPFAHGCIEELTPLFRWRRVIPIWARSISDYHLLRPRAVRVRGWMVMPDGPFERIHAFVNGRESYTCDPEPRDDLGQALSLWPDHVVSRH